MRSTGSTGPTAKRFLMNQAKIFGKQHYLQCAKLIKETLDSRYRIVLFEMTSKVNKTFKRQSQALLVDIDQDFYVDQVRNNVACCRRRGIWI